MNIVQRYLRKQLTRVLDGLADPAMRHVVRIAHEPHHQNDAESDLWAPAGALLSASQLAEHLKSDRVTKSHSVVLDAALTHVDDVYTALDGVADTWDAESRLINVSYNRLWRPFVNGFRRISRSERVPENWIPPDELVNQLEQTGFEIVEQRTAVILPVPVPLIGGFVNRWLAPLPVLRLLCVYNIVVARPQRTTRPTDPSVSVIIAARNEEGNIEPLVRRIPQLANRQEIIFVEGGSKDDTWGAIQRAIADRRSTSTTIKAFKQSGKGKGDAVRLGFAQASGDILIILDADISVPPEELTRFIDLLRRNACEFANGSRLVYPMEKQAMQFLNLIGNRLFGVAFTFLLGQPVRDTLCGTKALWATDYHRIAAQRSYFGDFDPFGDFDLLFGASRLHLKIRDVPVHYKERIYGSTNISRFRHGLLLLRMTVVAARKLRFV
jgi:hypothetical protein